VNEKRKWAIMVYFPPYAWYKDLNLGLALDLQHPTLQIYLPCFFITIGRMYITSHGRLALNDGRDERLTKYSIEWDSVNGLKIKRWM